MSGRTEFRRHCIAATLISAAIVSLGGCARHAPPRPAIRVSTTTQPPPAVRNGRPIPTVTPRERPDASTPAPKQPAFHDDGTGIASLEGNASNASSSGPVGTSSAPSGTAVTERSSDGNGSVEISQSGADQDTGASIPRWVLLFAAAMFAAIAVAAASVLTRSARTVSENGSSRDNVESIASHRNRRAG